MKEAEFKSPYEIKEYLIKTLEELQAAIDKYTSQPNDYPDSTRIIGPLCYRHAQVQKDLNAVTHLITSGQKQEECAPITFPVYKVTNSYIGGVFGVSD